ncbi:hypothetical protein A2335_03575 [Candidatus Peregrinibacteria bacterium RIFOXYB2_FULL_32_7]|nr:MAG: hypothetical protein A2335_03575 [Candidatus Peregrinibacteria bacterium RIFOXYB2_FULL_32_7]
MVFSASGDLSVDQSSVWMTPGSPVTSYDTIIYAKIKNNGDVDSIGTVTFTLKSSGEKIASDQPVSVLAGSTDDVFVAWKANYGTHDIVVKIIPWDASLDNPNNNSTFINFSVDYDTDFDMIGNRSDVDDDNDGCIDSEDLFPLDKKECLDSDGDSIGDNADEDADNDGCIDLEDAFLTDATECLDTDKDVIGNNKDEDDDGDALLDEEEIALGTDQLDADSDDDTINDKNDLFPLDPSESYDNDLDGIGDNADIDDDNDGFLDEEDEFPFNPAPVISFKNKAVRASINEEVVFDGSESYDPEGEEISFIWEIDGQKFSQPIVTYTFTEIGTYAGLVKVSDSHGQNREFQFQIYIRDYVIYVWGGIFLLILLAIGTILKYSSVASKRRK